MELEEIVLVFVLILTLAAFLMKRASMPNGAAYLMLTGGAASLAFVVFDFQTMCTWFGAMFLSFSAVQVCLAFRWYIQRRAVPSDSTRPDTSASQS